MERQDKGLAWMLRYENIAWYEDGVVRILDRRIYPIEVVKVECKTHQEGYASEGDDRRTDETAGAGTGCI